MSVGKDLGTRIAGKVRVDEFDRNIRNRVDFDKAE